MRTAANVLDGKALKHVCPKDGGMIFADKAYSSKETKNDIKRKGCYEGTFSSCQRRARYKGLAKVQLQVFMEAVVHNLKRWIKMEELANDLEISFG